MQIFYGHFRILVLLGFVGFSTLFLSYHPSSMPQGGQEIEIVIRNSTFIPQENIIKIDEPVTIMLRNQDKIRHGFTSVDSQIILI